MGEWAFRIMCFILAQFLFDIAHYFGYDNSEWLQIQNYGSKILGLLPERIEKI